MSRIEPVSPIEPKNDDSDESSFKDIAICCIDCEDEFIWSVGEQIFFRDKGLQNPPKRCKECKHAKNARIAAVRNANGGGRQKIEVAVDCAECGGKTTVPFYPSQGRPVYCRSCYLAMHPEVINCQDDE